jgi:carbon monoxide dehydrogenase subunit G
MQLRQRFVVNHPRATVWDFFGRIADVAPCMPGASLVEPPSGNAAKFQLNVKLGPISANFVGDAAVERSDADFRGVIRGNSRDSRGDSRVKSVVEYTLAEEAGGAATVVDISVDFTLTGRLAQFSRAGIVNDLATRLTSEFAKNLENALAPAAVAQPGQAPAAADDAMPRAPPTPAAAAPPKTGAKEINAGRLVLSVVWGRIKALLRSLFGR